MAKPSVNFLETVRIYSLQFHDALDVHARIFCQKNSVQLLERNSFYTIGKCYFPIV